MKKNIFLTGAPSSGKTTVIRKVIQQLSPPMQGFYTQEKRKNERRVGFLMHTLDGKQGYLAHENISSSFHIHRYGVSLENIESIAVPSISPQEDTIIILDEIAKMECFSPAFRKTALKALDSRNIVIGTIALGGDSFIRAVKERADIEIIEVTLQNRDQLPGQILKIVKALQVKNC